MNGLSNKYIKNDKDTIWGRIWHPCFTRE